MMRKRSIISLLLAFCLCFSMITPAMANDYMDCIVEQNSCMENVIESYSITSVNDEQYKNDILQLTNGQENINVKIMTTDKVIKDSDIKQAYYYAQLALQEDVNTVDIENASELFDYTLIVDDIVYFYERNINDPDNTIMEIYQVSQDELSVIATELEQYEALLEEQVVIDDSVMPRITINPIEIGDGFGGKVVINNTSNKYLAFNV